MVDDVYQLNRKLNSTNDRLISENTFNMSTLNICGWLLKDCLNSSGEKFGFVFTTYWRIGYIQILMCKQFR